MSELSLDALSAADKAKLHRPCYRTLSREQVHMTQLRFDPDCNAVRVARTLREAGYKVSQPDRNGCCWIMEK